MKYLKTALILAAICAVAAVVLAVLNSVTKPAIDAYELQKTKSALEAVAMGMEIGEKQEVSDNRYVTGMYPLYQDGKVSGYILELSSTGYGGELGIVAGYDKAGFVIGARLVSDSETPGVGKKAENPSYMDKFIGVDVPTSKSMLSDADAAAVSGATMTFNGVSKALAAGSSYVKSL